VPNDTVEALRDVLRWRPRFPIKRPNEPDPTRWLPAGFTPSESRPIVQRRINPRRIAKWRRPEREEPSAWGGRWALVHTLGTLGPEHDEQTLAERIAREWLARYGVVSRDWWRREHPAVGWREIYHELKRLEFRGEVLRGYFVAGLAGAQFALPEAGDLRRAPIPEENNIRNAELRPEVRSAAGRSDQEGRDTELRPEVRSAAGRSDLETGIAKLRPEVRSAAGRSDNDIVVMAVSDPANVYALPLAPGTAS